MPWIPEWLGVPYCIFQANYGSREFTFEEAKKDLGILEANLLKILSELGRYGFLLSKIENKSRRYVVVDFNSIAHGVKANSDLKNLDTPEKLRRVKGYGKNYLIVGSSAAFFYHAYQFPTRYEIEVYPRDYGFWKQLLPEAEIKPTLTDPKFRAKKIIDGLYVAPPERVVVEGIKKGGVSSALDSTSVLVSENGLKNLDWTKLEEYATQHQVVNEIGAVLEALSVELTKEYGKSPIPKAVLSRLHSHIRNTGRIKQYPRDIIQKDESYLEIGKTWRLRLYLPEDVIRKPVEDIAPFSLRVV
mgnify:CR=1 FL=1